MPGFEEALTEVTTNLRRGPPVPERREQQAAAQSAQAPQPSAGQALLEQQSPPENIRETQGFKDVRRVAVDEFTAGLLPFVEAAVAKFLQGDERAFDDIRREAQRRVQEAEQRLGADETGSIRTKGALGSVGLAGGLGALNKTRPALTGAALAGGVGFTRGATESIEEPTLSAERLTSGLEQGAIEAAGGAAAGRAVRAVQQGTEAARGAIIRRRQSSRRQSNADIRKRGQEITTRPGGDRLREILDEQPEGLFVEVTRGIAANQTIPEIARKIGASQEDVARAIVRNQDRFRRIEPGVSAVQIDGQQRTLDIRNVDRLTKEAKKVVDVADRFRALPPTRQRGSRRSQSPTQADSSRQASVSDQTGAARPSASERATARDLAADTGQPVRRAPQPALPNSVRARLAVQAIGSRPAGSKLENIQQVRESLSDENLPAVAEALGLDPARPRLRALVLNALDALRSPGVSVFTGASLGTAAALQGDEE